MIYNVLLFVCLFPDLISWLKQRQEKPRLRSSRTHLPLSPSILPFSPFLFVLVVCLYIPLSPLSCAFLSGFVIIRATSLCDLAMLCCVFLSRVVICKTISNRPFYRLIWSCPRLTPQSELTFFVFLFSCVLCVLIVTSTSNLQEAICIHSYNSNFK